MTNTQTSPRTAARRAAKDRAVRLAPFQAMSDRELIRAYHHGDRQAAYTVIVERVNARGIAVDCDRADDATVATVLSFEAAA